MTPDPSGAARAPQDLLREVKQYLDEEGACRPSALVSQLRAWLGALVQAVEDQQREIAKLNELRAIDAEDSEQRIQNFLWAQERAEKAEALVARLRADGQRLTGALETIYKIAAGGDVRRTAFGALHPDEAPPRDAP